MEFKEVTVCPHCNALTEERFSGDEGWTFCSDECGCLEGDHTLNKFECQKCYSINDDEKCNCIVN